MTTYLPPVAPADARKRYESWASSFVRRMRPTIAEREWLEAVAKDAIEAVTRPPVTVTQAAQVLGIPGSTPAGKAQKLRRLEAGVHPIIVAQRLGHSTPSFVMNTYGHVTPRMQEQATAALGRILQV